MPYSLVIALLGDLHPAQLGNRRGNLNTGIDCAAKTAMAALCVIVFALVVNNQHMGAAPRDNLFGAVYNRGHHLAGVLVTAGGDCCQGVDDHQAGSRRPIEIRGARKS